MCVTLPLVEQFPSTLGCSRSLYTWVRGADRDIEARSSGIGAGCRKPSRCASYWEGLGLVPHPHYQEAGTLRHPPRKVRSYACARGRHSHFMAEQASQPVQYDDSNYQCSVVCSLSPVQCYKCIISASAQADRGICCHDLGVRCAEFLIIYPYQCGSFRSKPTKRMGTIAARDLHRERRHSVKYYSIFSHTPIWCYAGKNASARRQSRGLS